LTGTGISAFSDPDDFEAALAGFGGVVELLVDGYNLFRAGITQIVLPHVRLAAVEESHSRVGYVAPASGTVRVVFPIGNVGAPIYAGVGLGSDEIITHRFGIGVHERTDRRCRWGGISLPVSYLNRYGRALAGPKFSLPAGMRRWLPPPAASARLRALHGAAVRAIESRPRWVPPPEATHGLEQELTDALIECLSASALLAETKPERRDTLVMTGLETIRQDCPAGKLPVSDICSALRVSDRTPRRSCKQRLGMGPSRYLLARRLQLARRALRRADPAVSSVAQVARQYGFTEPGRFAAAYRALVGELPSVTLRS
jgi:AraC-like DNA-binding protein